MTSPHNHRATVRRWTIGWTTTVVLGGALLGAPAAAAATASQAAPDGLSIAISDGSAETSSGASSSYTVTVTNRGTTPVTGELVIAVPHFVTFSEAEGARREKADAAWKVTIAPGASERRRASATVGRIPATEVRVTTLATLYDSADRARILVRAADANAIRGVLDPAHTVGQSPRKVGAAPNGPGLLGVVVGVGAGAALLAALIVGIVVFRRRRGVRATVPTHDG